MHSSSSRKHRQKDGKGTPKELPLHGNYDPHVMGHHPSQPSQYYIPVESPPTPAPSPGPPIYAEMHAMQGHYQPLGQLPVFPPFDTHTQDPVLRRQFLTSLLASCSPQELLFISQTIAPLLKRDFMLHLPPELALNVLSFIDDPKTLTRASRVSKHWYRIVRDEGVWRKMCYAHGFDDWDEAELEFQLTMERKQRRTRKGKEREKEADDGGSTPDLHSRRRSADRFSFRRYFKNSYIIRTNWRKGGELLKSHRLSIVSPDNGTVTSLALDSDWVVVGLASSMIKVFSAHTGVLCRTLVGHDSGVWGVCLVSKGGHRAPAPENTTERHSEAVSGEPAERKSAEGEPAHMQSESSSGRNHEKKTKVKGRHKHKQGRPEAQDGADFPSNNSKHHSDLVDGLSDLSLDPNLNRDGTHVMPSESLEHLVPPAMQIALGLDLLDSSGDSEGEGGLPSSPTEEAGGVFDEDAADNLRNPQSRRREGQQRDEEEAEELRDLGGSQGHVAPFNMSYSSRGWGQPNSIIVSGGCDKTVQVWDAKSGQCIYVLHGHTSTIRSIRVLHNRPIAVTGSRDATLRVWDVQLGRCLRVLEGHQQSVRCLDVCGNKVVSGSYDTTCRLWDIDTGECLHVLSGHLYQVYSVAFDGVRIASGGLDTTVRIWNPETGECLALLQGHTALVCELQLSPSTNILATGGSDGRVITFSLSTYKSLHRIAAHDSTVTSLQFDKNFLVTGGNDGRVRLFETESGSFVRELSEPSEGVWKVSFIKDLCAVMCKRAGKTVVEIWSLRPKSGSGRKSGRSHRAADGEAGTGVVASSSSRSS